jgi:hypothetical protein
MLLLLIFFIFTGSHDMHAAAERSPYQHSTGTILSDRKNILEQLASTVISDDGKRTLADIDPHEVTTIFNTFTKSVKKFGPKIEELNDELNKPRQLSSAYIESLLSQADTKEISETDLRRELARVTLCTAEQIDFRTPMRCTLIKPDPEAPLISQSICSDVHIEGYKTNVLIQLLYALHMPTGTTDEITAACLNTLGFNRSKEEYDNYYQSAVAQLNFIKFMLPLLASVNTEDSCDAIHQFAQLTQFHTTTRQKRNAEGLEVGHSFYFDPNLTKILLLLDHHFENYMENDDPDIPLYEELAKWRFNLFTGIAS